MLSTLVEGSGPLTVGFPGRPQIGLALRVPINHERSSGGVLVLVEGSAESVSSVDFQVGELGLLDDGCG
ncbi:hypothetical protein GCM10009575_083420 [Streptomyces rhizosphaericus]|uniref:Uncharacterized protein n=1 Tax=Streptomyces rhizosphaericus TaxID=114699 RepID=A0ABN1RDD6_9ACTN